MDDQHDAQCMKRLAQGDNTALEPLIKRYQHRVLAVAYRFMGNWADAEDVTQDVFLRAMRAADRYEPTAQLITWLYRIATNLCLDEKRKRSRRPQIAMAQDDDADVTSSNPSDALEASEMAKQIAAAIAQLPERQRMAIILLRYEGLTYKQIAESLEISPSATDSLISRAMSRLRELMQDLR